MLLQAGGGGVPGTQKPSSIPQEGQGHPIKPSPALKLAPESRMQHLLYEYSKCSWECGRVQGTSKRGNPPQEEQGHPMQPSPALTVAPRSPEKHLLYWCSRGAASSYCKCRGGLNWVPLVSLVGVRPLGGS